MNAFAAGVIVVFAVFGVISFVRAVSLLLFRYKKDNTVMFVTPVDGKCEDAEFMLRSAASKVKWISRGKNDYVICLNCDMDEETKKVCENICKEYGFARIVSKKEFLEMI